MLQPLIGIDIIEIDRIRGAISRWGDHFLLRIYTTAELELYRNKTESLAARFAGKEAVMKALSADQVPVSWREIEILSGPGDKPVVKLYGRVRERALELGIGGLDISLSHSRQNLSDGGILEW